METDSGFLMRSQYCFVKWLTTCSNQVKYVQLLHSDDKNAASFAQAFKIVVLVEAILGEEKSYPKPVRPEADF